MLFVSKVLKNAFELMALKKAELHPEIPLLKKSYSIVLLQLIYYLKLYFQRQEYDICTIILGQIYSYSK